MTKESESLSSAERLAEKLRELADRTSGYIYANECSDLRDAADEIDRLRDHVNRGRSYRETLEGLPKGTLPRV